MLLVVGSNHRSAPVAFRERLAVAAEEQGPTLARLLSRPEIEEGAILSTCNRVEVVVRGVDGEPATLRAVREMLVAERGVCSTELDRYTYHFEEREAVQHLFRVASGLDSMIVGEPQILGQVKQAYRTAREAASIGPVLDRLFQHGFSAAKRVRTETGIARHPVSVAYAAVKLAARIFGDLHGRRALLLGAGKMSDLLARHLRSHGIGSITVASRTFNQAVLSAERVGGSAVHWDDGRDHVRRVDIVISATGASSPVLTKTDVAGAMRGRRGGPLFVIDLAVPRDVDPRVQELDDVYLYDIDALQGVVDTSLDERRAAAEKAESVVAREVEQFYRWHETHRLAPTIVALREALLDVGRSEVRRSLRRLGPLTPEQESGIEEIVRATVGKILHRPIRHLRGAVQRGDVAASTRLYREIFGLDGEPVRGERGADDGPAKREAADRPRLLEGGKEG